MVRHIAEQAKKKTLPNKVIFCNKVRCLGRSCLIVMHSNMSALPSFFIHLKSPNSHLDGGDKAIANEDVAMFLFIYFFPWSACQIWSSQSKLQFKPFTLLQLLPFPWGPTPTSPSSKVHLSICCSLPLLSSFICYPLLKCFVQANIPTQRHGSKCLSTWLRSIIPARKGLGSP